MAFSSSVSLAIAELTIYLILAPMVLFALVKHRLVGLLGWFYLSAFCAVRIAGDAITISDRDHKTPNPTTSAILNSVGLSPLILATAGVLHEATYYATSDRRIRFFNVVTQVLIHFLAMGGIALGVVAGVNLSSPQTPNNQYLHDHTLQEAGSILVMLAWLTNVGYAIWLAMFISGLLKRTESSGLRKSRILWLASIVALPFIGVRTCYTVTYAFDHSPSVSPLTASFAIKFVLVFLVQLIAAISLSVGGILTRNFPNSAADSGGSGSGPEVDNRMDLLQK